MMSFALKKIDEVMEFLLFLAPHLLGIQGEGVRYFLPNSPISTHVPMKLKKKRQTCGCMEDLY